MHRPFSRKSWAPCLSRVSRFFFPVWLAPRFYWALGGIALLLACSPGLSFFVPLAIAFAILLLAATIVDAAFGPAPGAISVERRLPPHFALRSPAKIVYGIENRSTHAVRCGFVDSPVATLQLETDETMVRVPAQTAIQVENSALPISRGSDTFEMVALWHENRVGLLRRRVRYTLPEPFRVYPDLAAVERYGALHVRNKILEAGLRRMRLRGGGSEFESLREYAAGDAFRTVDWKATARRGKLMVVQHEVERSQDVMLVLDCGRLMTARVGDQRKLDYAITAALSLASIASLARDRVGVTAFASEMLVARAPRSTASSVRALTNAVCDLEPRFEESDYARAASYLRSRLHRRTLIVLFTDVIDPVAQSTVLAELNSLAKRHVVLCVFMNDRAVVDALSAVPDRVDEAYQMDIALGLAHERAHAAATLARSGIDVLDVPAAQLAVATIDKYLLIKQRGRL